MDELISVIVATYNREDALDAVLRGLAHQSDRNFEVIVADDGSGPQTAQVIASWSSRINVRLIHVRHEDRGFRLAEIRNRAIAASRGAICVFLDGDCIPRRKFIAAHRCLAETGYFVAGNRILISRDMTARILDERLHAEEWPLSTWIAARLRGEINRITPIFRLSLGPLRKFNADRWQGARGSNLAIRREDLVRVDGFDAAFSGWGLEDSDIIIRLLRAGVRRKDGRFATGVLHLWHPENDRSKFADNQIKLRQIIESDRLQAGRGLSALLPEQGSVGSRIVRL
ncbi:MAG TPA: glycosyltransferase [Xanthobacteraceae bacterium]|jgi:glycosyltransferase involved in cell wall biosynthesis|nr:glycosyltransferase [Xanthobacteraceae bacterium]